MENMTISSLDVVYFTFAFLVPGYIIDEIIDKITPTKKEKIEIRFLRCLLYSVVNYVLWAAWGIRLIDKFFKDDDITYWIIIALGVIVTGILTGIIVGVLKAVRISAKILNPILLKMNIALKHPAPSAWDYQFNKLQSSCGEWVIVRLKSGNVVYGRYGSGSFSSSEESERDLYLEKIYIFDQNKTWVETERTDGIWISASEISTIEFVK